MFNTPVRSVNANKLHKCSWCGELIIRGETYKTWKSVDEVWYTSKLHLECYKALREDYTFDGGNSDYSYTPNSNERPKEEGCFTPTTQENL